MHCLSLVFAEKQTHGNMATWNQFVNYCMLGFQFTDDPSVAICSDSGGSVFVLTFK